MVGEPDAGYATPAAAVICFAIAMTTAALSLRSVTELRLARADLASIETDYALAAAQNAAMAAIATSSRPPPYRWTVASLGQAVGVVAEPEWPKVRLAAAANLDDEDLRWLGASDPAATRLRLVAAAAASRLVWSAEQSPEARWRACAAAHVSPYGAAVTLAPLAYGEPRSEQQAGRWRAGEVWRIQVTLPSGWRDERIVRFTGDGVHPAVVIGRRLLHAPKGPQTCDA